MFDIRGEFAVSFATIELFQGLSRHNVRIGCFFTDVQKWKSLDSNIRAE
jgi:transcription-repair coupling factor (superfamily II helicase)